MPRIRTIKPDAYLSESLTSVPRGTRWTFAGLWTYADDKGRARDEARLIHAALYPLDDEVTLDDVKHDLILLAGIGAICRYVVDGRSYLHMPSWEQHQKINRPTPAKSPPCPLHEDGERGHVLPPDDSVMTHGGLSEPSTWERKGREVDREGEGSISSDKSDHSLDRFDEFWDAYGNKVGRKKSEVAYRAALRKPGVTDDLLISSAAAYAKWCLDTRTYQKNPLTWLHGEHWRDERIERVQTLTRVQEHLALVHQLAAEEAAEPTLPQIG